MRLWGTPSATVNKGATLASAPAFTQGAEVEVPSTLKSVSRNPEDSTVRAPPVINTSLYCAPLVTFLVRVFDHPEFDALRRDLTGR